jgi:hypothetical protein
VLIKVKSQALYFIRKKKHKTHEYFRNCFKGSCGICLRRKSSSLNIFTIMTIIPGYKTTENTEIIALFSVSERYFLLFTLLGMPKRKTKLSFCEDSHLLNWCLLAVLLSVVKDQSELIH